MKLPDIIAILTIVAVLIATCIVSHERGLEASSLLDKVAILEQQIQDLRPILRITVERATIYPTSGEIVLEEVK